jgi:DHA1 family bicyclomycin/chloramphenicol resistance-like MFS transporter
MTIAAGSGALVGYLHNGTSLVMASVIALSTFAALASYVLLVQRFPAPGFEAEARV